MRRPRRPRKGEDPNQILWHETRAQFERLGQYCIQDVRTEYERWLKSMHIANCCEPGQIIDTGLEAVQNRGIGLIAGTRLIQADILVNASFFVLKREILRYMQPQEERVIESFQRLIREQQLTAYDEVFTAKDSFTSSSTISTKVGSRLGQSDGKQPGSQRNGRDSGRLTREPERGAVPVSHTSRRPRALLTPSRLRPPRS
jgi:hypothetical protein